MRIALAATLAATVVLAAAGCSADPQAAAGGADGREGAVGSVAEPIVGGTVSPSTEDAVVALGIRDEDLCTATLLTPNLILTARHCVANIGGNSECGTFGPNYDPSELAVYVGPNASARDQTVAAHGIRTFTDASTSGCSHDIALVELDHDIPDALVMPVRFTALAASEPVKTIGYGENGSGDFPNQRMEKTGLTIDALGPTTYTYVTKNGQHLQVDVDPGEVVTGESTCFGDSGGPLVDAQGSLVGVTSRGIDQYCNDRPSIYSDVASHMALITGAADASGHPLATPGSVDPSRPADAGPVDPPPTEAAASSGGASSSGDDGSDGKKPSGKKSPGESAGCSASPSHDEDPAAFAFAAAAAVVLARIRRRARRTPAAPAARASADLRGGGARSRG